jgi:hypothetical protein
MGSMAWMSKGGGGGRGECDDSLPEAVQAEKKFNFLAADDFAGRFHGALAAGALERVAAPNL